MFFVYVLYGVKSNRFYIGYSGNLQQRVDTHLKYGNHTTKGLDNPELVYYEACISEKDARKRELQLKTGFGRQYLRNRIKNHLDSLQIIK